MMNTNELTNRLELKELVDTFSILADTKDVDQQLLLFKEDALVTSRISGQPGNSYQGRQEIGQAFTNYLNLFHTVYHINGQQTVNFTDDTHATGIAYCQVVLIRDADGKEIQLTQGVRYHDSYEKVDGKWLIAKRESNFMWSRTDTIEQ
ncbi:nuclear transport factor 2 family protein [uncultured Streptococcus sp.]|uniref:nuclear transport factor 2 family protein n=1 Tax=uncultured Streptococcus sp. TaxID=83427 RepID=UPI00280B9816|nr:nuclear transport factor 2 family protein [uncultured Streptococcus sp.]